jgi:hypothetical protein
LREPGPGRIAHWQTLDADRPTRWLFTDPDGNTWLVHEVTTRLPGRIDATQTGYASATELNSAVQRAEAAHRAHEKRAGRSHLLHRSAPDTD